MFWPVFVRPTAMIQNFTAIPFATDMWPKHDSHFFQSNFRKNPVQMTPRRKKLRFEVRGVLTIPFKITVTAPSEKQAEMTAWDSFLRKGIKPHVKGKYQEFKVTEITCKNSD